MNCCQVQAIDREFGRRTAERDLRRYRRRGPRKTTRLLIEALVNEGVAGRTLLDIGGGIGAIQHALLAAGAERVEAVEASQAYLETARDEAERRGLTGRTRMHYGDFVAMADSLAPADVVTLDRVICCYPDMPALVGRSVGLSRSVYGLVYPRDKWWNKLGIGLFNRICWLWRNPFRAFVHPTVAVDAIVREHGFVLRMRRSTPIWQVVVYARS